MSHDLTPSIRKRLEQARLDRGYTQTDFARKTGLKQTAISKIERGKRNTINQSDLASWANAADVSEDWLLCRSSNKNSRSRSDPDAAGEARAIGEEGSDADNGKHDITHAKLEAIQDRIELLIKQARPQGVAEEAVRAIAAKISTTMHNAPIDDILLHIQNFVESAKREKKRRGQSSNEVANLAALRASAGKLLDVGQLDKASSPFDAELQRRRKARAERVEEEMREEVGLLEEAAEYDRLALATDRAIERYLEAAVLSSQGDAESEFDYLSAKALALSDTGEMKGDRAALLVSIGLWHNLLPRFDGFERRFRWASCQVSLGNALQSLGESERGTERLEQAVTAYREALKIWGSERALFQWGVTQEVPFGLFGLTPKVVGSAGDLLNIYWAGIQINLGNSIRTLAHRKGNTARLEDAVSAFREALKVLTRERNPDEWAGAQHSLGIALEILGNTEHLQQALAAYQEALKVLTRERKLRQWAIVQNSVGTVLMSLAECEENAAKLEQAVGVFRGVLKEITREHVPLDWATTQHNLGRALHTLGERTSETARLGQAIAAYREALKVFAHERTPHQCDITEHNLACAQKLLSERRR